MRIPTQRFAISGATVTLGTSTEATLQIGNGRQARGAGKVRIAGISNHPRRRASIWASFDGSYRDARGRPHRIKRRFSARVPAAIWYRIVESAA